VKVSTTRDDTTQIIPLSFYHIQLSVYVSVNCAMQTYTGDITSADLCQRKGKGIYVTMCKDTGHRVDRGV